MRIRDPRPVHLLFERGRGPMAWLVRLFTRSRFAHVAIVFRDGAQWWVCEADFALGAVTVVPGAQFRGGTYLRVPTRVGMTDTVRRFLFTEIQGKKYDRLDALRAAAGLQPRNQGYQCAELVQRLFAVAGGSLPYAPTPQRVLDQLRTFPGHEEFTEELP